MTANDTYDFGREKAGAGPPFFLSWNRPLLQETTAVFYAALYEIDFDRAGD